MSFIEYYDDDNTTDYHCTIREQPRWDSHWDWEGNTTHTVIYQVETSSISGHRAGPVVVGRFMRQQGFKLGSIFYRPDTGERDTTTLLTGMDVSCSGARNNPHLYEVTCTYGRVTNAGGGLTSPLDIYIPPVWSTEEVEIPLVFDFAGTAVKNSAGDILSPPLTTPITRDVLVYTRNEATYDHNYANTFRNTCNADVWNGYGAKVVRLRNVSAEQIEYPYTNKVYYYRVRYEFVFWDGFLTPDAASTTVLDSGWRQLVSGNLVKIWDANGQEPAVQPLLNGSGVALAAGATPTALNFQIYDTSDFDALNIIL